MPVEHSLCESQIETSPEAQDCAQCAPVKPVPRSKPHAGSSATVPDAQQTCPAALFAQSRGPSHSHESQPGSGQLEPAARQVEVLPASAGPSQQILSCSAVESADRCEGAVDAGHRLGVKGGRASTSRVGRRGWAGAVGLDARGGGSAVAGGIARVELRSDEESRLAAPRVVDLRARVDGGVVNGAGPHLITQRSGLGSGTGFRHFAGFGAGPRDLTRHGAIRRGNVRIEGRKSRVTSANARLCVDAECVLARGFGLGRLGRLRDAGQRGLAGRPGGIRQGSSSTLRAGRKRQLGVDSGDELPEHATMSETAPEATETRERRTSRLRTMFMLPPESQGGASCRTVFFGGKV